MEILTSSPELDEGLIKPEHWANEEWIHAQLKWLRDNDPLRRTEPDGFDPFWNVTKYNDIKEVEQNKSIFINDPRPVLGPKMVMQSHNNCQDENTWLGLSSRWTILIT